jgi:hypothetical protein
MICYDERLILALQALSYWVIGQQGFEAGISKQVRLSLI